MSLPAIFSSNPPRPSPPENPWLSSSAANAGGGVAGIRLPSAPWMKSPPKPRIKILSTKEDNFSYKFLTSGVRGGRSQDAMRKILKSLSLLRKTLPQSPNHEDLSIDLAILNSLDAISPSEERRIVPWAKEERLEIPRLKKKKKKILNAADLVLPAEEIDRLRGEAMKMKKWIRGKKAGVTPEVMEGIRRAWRKNELAMVKIVDPLRHNMVRAHEILEVSRNSRVWEGR